MWIKYLVLPLWPPTASPLNSNMLASDGSVWVERKAWWCWDTEQENKQNLTKRGQSSWSDLGKLRHLLKACHLDRSNSPHFIIVLRSWRKQQQKGERRTPLERKHRYPLAHIFSFPAIRIESCKSLKLVGNLTDIIVQAIRVIDCLDALSACIISPRWLRPGLGRGPGVKWLRAGGVRREESESNQQMSDKILQFALHLEIKWCEGKGWGEKK